MFRRHVTDVAQRRCGLGRYVPHLLLHASGFRRDVSEGYIPLLVRNEMKERWKKMYDKLRKEHENKTKASIIHMIHRDDVVYNCLLPEKNEAKRVSIRKLFLRWSATTYRDDPKPDVVFRRRNMADILMGEADEIRRNLRLLNWRDVDSHSSEDEDKEDDAGFIGEKRIVPYIDRYGNTELVCVARTPIDMIDDEEIPSTSSRRDEYDRLERERTPSRKRKKP